LKIVASKAKTIKFEKKNLMHNQSLQLKQEFEKLWQKIAR
jgi:hypothetical protein